MGGTPHFGTGLGNLCQDFVIHQIARNARDGGGAEAGFAGQLEAGGRASWNKLREDLGSVFWLPAAITLFHQQLILRIIVKIGSILFQMILDLLSPADP